jgi:hypothetical protein
MTPTAPSNCPTALIISQFIMVTLARLDKFAADEIPGFKLMFNDYEHDHD